MKQRLDVYLVAQKLVQSRERAKELIESKQVLVNGQPAQKAGHAVNESDQIQIVGEQNPYVSRGGLKLRKAILAFNLSLQNKIAIDIGASTGGFTQCMLEHGAKKVYAVDVGRGQLHPSLADHPLVVNLEQTDVRTLTLEQAEMADFISVDVSFISLTLILPHIKRFLKETGKLAVLIKPQFEAGKAHVGKKGVVKDKAVHEQVLRTVLSFAQSIDLIPEKLSYSPIRGPEGNIEYLALLCHKQNANGSLLAIQDAEIKTVVEQSHLEL